LSDEVEAEVRGRDVGSGLAKTAVLSSEEMRGALEKPLVRIVEAIKETLARTPPDLGCEIVDRGMMLAGGGSLLRGLRERLREETKMPAQLAEYPLTCVVAGSGIWLHELAMRDDWKVDPRDGIGSETRG
jgi:rod shape-determining protein MreB